MGYIFFLSFQIGLWHRPGILGWVFGYHPLYSYCTIAIYMNMRNVHEMFITYIHRTSGSQNTKNTYDSSVQVRSFLLPLSLKVFRHNERERHSLSILAFSSAPPPHLVRHLPKASASKRKSNLLVRYLVSTLRTDFFKISENPPHASGAWRHSHLLAPFPITGYCDICEWHVCSARAHAHAREHLR